MERSLVATTVEVPKLHATGEKCPMVPLCPGSAALELACHLASRPILVYASMTMSRSSTTKGVKLCILLCMSR